jgi:2-polyprenyl-3-methyl-5-hydroxy-6-metoxy-1,4-benzoquinol methylase
MKHTRDRTPRKPADARQMVNQKVESLTDAQYWDRTWAGRAIPQPLDSRGRGLNSTVPRRWRRFFSQVFASLGIRAGDRLLEAGCGGSVFLPYFVREYGLAAEGLDNSPEGCELSGAIARRSGFFTPIHFGDVLHPDAALLGQYRVVFSVGLAEHFMPTTSIISALSAFLQPSGCLITVVPNMHGIVGTLQKLVDPAIYSIHVPLSPAELAEAHRASGLSVLSAQHLMTANFSIVNFSGPDARLPPAIGLRLASWTSKLIWTLERAGLPEFPNGWTSPYVVVVAQRAVTAAPRGATQ